MTTLDNYVALLEKRATSEAEVLHDSVPPNDSAEATTQEYNKNMADNRQYLHGVFGRAGAVESQQSAMVGKLFSNVPKGAISGHPLMKVASREPFFEVVQRNGNFMKTASPFHLEVAYNAFCDELTKIATANRA